MNCANYCYSQHSATKTPASTSPFSQTRTSPRKMAYNSATRAHFLCIHLILSRLDLIFTIRVKHQKNASPAKIWPFRPFFTANKAPKAQNQGQNTPKTPSIYIFTNDTIQLGAKADTFTNQSSHHKKQACYRTTSVHPIKSPSEKYRLYKKRQAPYLTLHSEYRKDK